MFKFKLRIFHNDQNTSYINISNMISLNGNDWNISKVLKWNLSTWRYSIYLTWWLQTKPTERTWAILATIPFFQRMVLKCALFLNLLSDKLLIKQLLKDVQQYDTAEISWSILMYFSLTVAKADFKSISIRNIIFIYITLTYYKIYKMQY